MSLDIDTDTLKPNRGIDLVYTIQKYLDFKTNPDIYKIDFTKGEKEPSIIVEKGDWKHDHEFIDGCMSQIGYKLKEEKEIGHSGNDTYSSVHYYELNSDYDFNKQISLIDKEYDTVKNDEYLHSEKYLKSLLDEKELVQKIHSLR